MMNPLRTFVVPALIVLLAAPAFADVGLGLEISADLQLDQPVSIIVAPDGGEALTEGLAFGSHPNDRVDATFTITIRNEGGVPITGYPAEDIWLQTSHDGELALCAGGANPDGPTDAQGRTTFFGPFRMGGHCEVGGAVYLTVWAGTYVVLQPRLDIRLVSPDLDGDLKVDLSDVYLFASDYLSGQNPSRSDFVWDGVLNLSDLIVFADHVNAQCGP